MSKRKTAGVSKPARNSKIAAKSQRASQAVIRSSKASRRLPLVTPASTKSSTEDTQEAHPVFGEATISQDDAVEHTVGNDFTAGFGFPSAASIVRAYQANLLDMAQANMEFTLEFAQRFAAIKSPGEFPSVIAEFTGKRIAMFEKYSKKMVEMGTKRAV